jgi:hypothetical protein
LRTPPLVAERDRLKVLVRTVRIILASPTLRPPSGPQLARLLELSDELRGALTRAACRLDRVVGRAS